jgi:hypothetical protein
MSDLTAEELKSQFIAWQCRIRQYSVRKSEGRLSSGMQPELSIGDLLVGPITVQLVMTDSEDVTGEFKFMVQKTQDPKDRYEAAIKLLSEYYYQIPTEFDEEIVAVFSVGSVLAAQIVEAGTSKLKFDQGNQIYHMNCKTRMVDPEEPKYKAAYWHNSLFNPSMPGVVAMVGFTPDWNISSFNTGALD